jgi:hypothetical protein
MPNVIDFLERMGQDAGFRNSTLDDIQGQLSLAGLDPMLAEVLRAGTQRELEELLGARVNVCCLVRTPDDEDEPEQEDEPDTDEDVRGHSPMTRVINA